MKRWPDAATTHGLLPDLQMALEGFFTARLAP